MLAIRSMDIECEIAFFPFIQCRRSRLNDKLLIKIITKIQEKKEKEIFVQRFILRHLRK